MESPLIGHRATERTETIIPGFAEGAGRKGYLCVLCDSVADPPDYRFEYWTPRRAPRRPYFLRSFMRGSRVSNPAARRTDSSAGSIFLRARAMPSFMAPAWPPRPPPEALTMMSLRLQALVV